MKDFLQTGKQFCEANRAQIEELRKKISWHKDFPKPGILFQDFTPMLHDPNTLETLVDLFARRFQDESIDVICGLESRGFILGAPLAIKLKAGFVPIRKKNKLPGETFKASYTKEYGEDAFELSKNALAPHQRVLLIDDLIATGGSIVAALNLVRQSNANPVYFACLLAISELDGFSKINIPFFQLID